MLGKDRATVAAWGRDGRLHVVEVDGKPRIPLKEIERIERVGLPRPEERPRRRRQKAAATSKMTAAQVAAELAKF